jgi:uncharacterized membrane protein (UPF0127 family)
MTFKQTCAAFLTLFLVLSSLSCTENSGLETSILTIKNSRSAEIKVTAEIARTVEQRAQGLMSRKSLEDGRGMLFVFERDQIMSFWMKDTLIPLSIAYISSSGLILEIHDMQPLNQLPVYSSSLARYALEVPQGWFNKNSIKPGDRISLP